MSETRFPGTWKLIAGEYRHSDGTVTYPWGNPPAGQIMYTADGHMAAQIMRLGRPNFIFKDHMKGTDTEIREAFEGYQAYYGTYVIKEAENIIDHLVTGSVFPNLIGHTLKRYYAFSENAFSSSRLTLSTPPMKMGGTTVTGILVWEHI
jgi:hypothetical protein